MTRKLRAAMTAALIGLCLTAMFAQAQDARTVAARIDARYNGMRTLSAQFTEIYSGGGLRRSESGTLTIKKPGKMRWDYATPTRKLFVTDGHTAWFYVPGERQARRTALKKLDDLRTPLRFLLGRTQLARELRGLSLARDLHPEAGGNVVLRGVPVGMQDRVAQMILEADDAGYVRRIVVEELDGSRTEFRLTAQRENLPLSDGEFSFRPPSGVEVMQSDRLNP